MNMGSGQDFNPAEYDSVLTTIVDYVYDFQVTSLTAWARAKSCLIDSFGVILETLRTSDEAVQLIGPPFPCTSRTEHGVKIPGTQHQLDVLKGAFDIGTLIRYLDHNDAFPGAEWGHPSDNLGAILATADVLARTARARGETEAIPTVRTVCEALIKAYEIQGVFQIKNAFNQVGLDHTILVKVASTAVTSWLFRLNREQAKAAVSHAWCDGHPLRAYRQYPNVSPRKGWAAGEACMRAVHLTLVARQGQPGMKTILTCPKWGFYDVLFKGNQFDLPQPFGSWVVENVLYKINTAEGHAMTGVEAALKIAHEFEKLNLSPENDVASISIRTQRPAMIIIDKTRTLTNPADRDHCFRYMVAVVLLKGSMIDTADYQDDSPWATDSRVEELRQRITMTEDPQMTADYHDLKKRSVPNGLTVTLKDGTVMEEVLVEYPQGHVARTDTTELVLKKAEKNMRQTLSDDKVDEILKVYRDADFDRVHVDTFIDLFCKSSK